MKRRREVERGSEMRAAIEEMSLMVKVMKKKPMVVGGGEVDDVMVSTRPFLSICYFVLRVLDKIGPTMAVLRQDIDQNIERIERLYEVDPTIYSNMVEMLKKGKSAKKGICCCKAIVWLTRSLDFTAALLQRLSMEGAQINMEQMVEESYNVTLKPWHGWISSAASKVALKLVPEKNTLMGLLSEKGENRDTLKEEMQTLNSLLVPYLQHIHSILRFYGLDRLKST